MDLIMDKDLALLYYNIGNVYQYNVLELETHWKSMVRCYLPKYETKIVECVYKVRDIRRGYGCHHNFYMMLYVLWQEKHLTMVTNILERVVDVSPEQYQIGCYKDLIGFLKYISGRLGRILRFDEINNDDNFAVIVNKLVCRINTILLHGCGNSSLMSKWIPREQNKTTRWIFHLLAYDYFFHCLGKTCPKMTIKESKHHKKICMMYRKMVSKLTAPLDLIESKLCAKKAPDVSKVSRSSGHTHSSVLTRSFGNRDIVMKSSAFHYLMYTNQTYQNNVRGLIPPLDQQIGAGTNYMLSYFVREMLHLLQQNAELVKMFSEQNKITGVDMKTYCDVKNRIHNIDNEWKSMLHYYNKPLTNVLPLVDNSWHTMYEGKGHAYHVALAWACLIASKTELQPRILVMEQTPIWVIIEHGSSLSTMLQKIVMEAKGGTTCSLTNTMHLLCEAFEKTDTNEPYSLVILSNMQFYDAAVDTLHASINAVFNDKLVTRPNMVYWNVGNLFMDLPANMDDTNACIMSGEASYLYWRLHTMTTPPFMGMQRGAL
jgi:general stress protein 26